MEDITNDGVAPAPAQLRAFTLTPPFHKSTTIRSGSAPTMHPRNSKVYVGAETYIPGKKCPDFAWGRRRHMSAAARGVASKRQHRANADADQFQRN